MSTIYLSYHARDREMVSEYAELFRKSGHQIINESDILKSSTNFERPLMELMKRADGTIVFLTRNSIESTRTSNEISMARSYQDGGNKFLIAVTGRNMPAFEPIPGLERIVEDIEDRSYVVNTINSIIGGFQSQKKTEKGSNPKSLSHNLDGRMFAAGLFDFLSNSRKGSMISGWNFEGETDIAYDTPAGSWTKPGFLFRNVEYSFIIRSIADAGYLVIESNNLKGQLVNHSLNSVDKFENKKGEVTISEAYDMTVGYGRRSRAEVERAFSEVGFPSNTITKFKETEINWEKIIGDILTWAIFRERAKALIQHNNANQDEDDRQYWLIDMVGDNRDLSKIEENEHAHIAVSWHDEETEIKFESFERIKNGDIAIGYNSDGLLYELKISEVSKQEINGKKEVSISFIVTERILPIITIDDLKPHLPLFVETFDSPDHRIYSISIEDYKTLRQINKGEGSSPDRLSKLSWKVSIVSADSASADIRDELGFESDVEALASVIALKEVKPPLAIGLFGNWGSGKSFFMNKLQQRIDGLSKSNAEIFCQEVVQINFNSWHYSDSNLWASLITKIFEGLKLYGQKDTSKLDALFQNLHSTQEMLIDKKQEMDNVNKEIMSIKERQQKIDDEIKETTSNLKNLTPDQIAAGVLKDPEISKDLEKLKKEYSFLDIDEYREINEKTRELRTGIGKLIDSVKLAYTFRKGKLWIALAIALASFFVVYYLLDGAAGVKTWLWKYKEIVAGFALFVSQSVAFLRPAFKKITSVHKRLLSLKESCDQLIENERLKKNAEQKELENKLDTANKIQSDLRLQLEILKTKRNQLLIDIEDISSGKKITRFIEDRVKDERYINSLGIISWIRKDFEELDFLLKQQWDSKRIADLQRIEVKTVFQVDRIILYIDDLDRCDVSIVIRVLEAINLLLAFPLFVVIVGVDPRWVNKALSNKYEVFLTEDKKMENESPLFKEMGRQATSYDYLEKIFQIPFVLKPMDKMGKDKLIRSQLEQHLATAQAIMKPIIEADIESADDIPGSKSQVDSEKSEVVHEKDQFDHKEKNEVLFEKPQTERLQITEEEIKFMQAINFLIGDSPRTIKRYINIYRIIRTHKSFDQESKDLSEQYFSAMILLAVITGTPEQAGHFFKALEAYDNTAMFEKFINTHAAAQKKVADFRSVFLKLSGFLESESGRKIGKLKIRDFKRHTSLIGRFSFRSLE
jgi:KAP family P-loop domain/TIR domain